MKIKAMTDVDGVILDFITPSKEWMLANIPNLELDYTDYRFTKIDGKPVFSLSLGFSQGAWKNPSEVRRGVRRSKNRTGVFWGSLRNVKKPQWGSPEGGGAKNPHLEPQ